MTDRICTKCKQTKPATLEYFRYHNNKSGLRPDCRVCNLEQHATWRAANKERLRLRAAEYRAENREKIRASSRRYGQEHRQVRIDQGRALRLKHQYGLSVEQYMAIFDSQGGVCAYCSEPPVTRPLDVDHDHETGKIRGLLCPSCNGGLGKLGDSVAGLLRMIDYLQSVDKRISPVMPEGPAHEPTPKNKARLLVSLRKHAA